MTETSKVTLNGVNVGALIHVKGYLGQEVGNVLGNGVITGISPSRDRVKAFLVLNPFGKPDEVISSGEYIIPVELVSENEVELEFITTRIHHKDQ